LRLAPSIPATSRHRFGLLLQPLPFLFLPPLLLLLPPLLLPWRR